MKCYQSTQFIHNSCWIEEYQKSRRVKIHITFYAMECHFLCYDASMKWNNMYLCKFLFLLTEQSDLEEAVWILMFLKRNYLFQNIKVRFFLHISKDKSIAAIFFAIFWFDVMFFQIMLTLVFQQQAHNNCNHLSYIKLDYPNPLYLNVVIF